MPKEKQMKDQLMSHYQELFDIQLMDLTALADLQRKLDATNNVQGIYQRKAQIIDLKAAIDKRSLLLIGLDEKIQIFGSLTIKEAARKTA